MKTPLFIATLVAFSVVPFVTYAHGDEDHGKKDYSFGTPAKESDATRTIAVKASDDMKFTPSELTVKQGETIKFLVTNTGQLVHEFNVGDVPSQRAHALMMEKMPDMHHEGDPTVLTLKPGETKSLVWSFNKRPTAPIEIACQEVGHYKQGMKIKVTLTN